VKRNRPPIEHIVVLMMENHSYDNYLGMLQCRGESGLQRTPGPGGACLARPRASHTR
jgi:phospholipase C